jgi:hypothetical protein
MRWYRDRGSGGLRPRDVGDVCDMEAEDVYPTRCGNIAVKRNTRTAMPSDRLGHCVTLALGPHSCPCPCHLGGWWLMMAGVSNRLNTARLLGTLFLTTCSLCPPRRNFKPDGQLLITRRRPRAYHACHVTSCHVTRCSYSLRHTALCSCGASQPQLSTVDALAIMLIYRGISSERGPKHVRHASILLLRSAVSTLPPRCWRGSVRESVVQPG